MGKLIRLVLAFSKQRLKPLFATPTQQRHSVRFGVFSYALHPSVYLHLKGNVSATESESEEMYGVAHGILLGAEWHTQSERSRLSAAIDRRCNEEGTSVSGMHACESH